MIIVAAYLLVLVSVPICGGRLVKLGQLRIRKLWTINTALAIQILIVNIAEHQIAPSLGAAIHLASYALALVFLWANRRLPGLGVVVAGGVDEPGCHRCQWWRYAGFTGCFGRGRALAGPRAVSELHSGS